MLRDYAINLLAKQTFKIKIYSIYRKDGLSQDSLDRMKKDMK